MVKKLITVQVDEEQFSKKRELMIPWRFILAKGFDHLKVCVPNETIMIESLRHAGKARNGARMMYWLKEKYPKIHDEFIAEGE